MKASVCAALGIYEPILNSIVYCFKLIVIDVIHYYIHWVIIGVVFRLAVVSKQLARHFAQRGGAFLCESQIVEVIEGAKGGTGNNNRRRANGRGLEERGNWVVM